MELQRNEEKRRDEARTKQKVNNENEKEHEVEVNETNKKEMEAVRESGRVWIWSDC